ncbi:glycoside hydrolase family 43 protein [Microbacter margulisiae]|uniref:Beta-glucanase n=1 Tax=Microbacter margulisiae TaxID=1350067 RepID=A0A7W5DRR4_9PORP|nr:glycoside hydrolase family 43 protein [Microbacter margulisiae]MBB3187359.1 hypothetical protein [Microbacter margulisiae]
MKNRSKHYLIPAVIVLSLVVYAGAISAKSEKVSNQQTAQRYDSFRPGAIWNDTNGKVINAHGGGIIYYKGVYYWFGEHKITGPIGNTAQVGVHCYASKDLYNWKDEGIALHVSDDPHSDITKGCILERPKVIYNKKTRKFVMWFHLELKGEGYSAARAGVAISDRPAGPYTFLRSLRPNAGIWPLNFKKSWETSTLQPDSLKGWTPAWMKAVEEGLFVRRDFKTGQMFRDMTAFVDTDGKAYLIYSSEENLTLQIAQLNDDYTGFSGKYVRVFPGGHNEGPAIFKDRGKYYMVTSGCTGWAPNAARSGVASSIFGPWKALGNPCVGQDSALTFHGQSTYILPVEGKKNAFIFMADRWNPQNPIDGRYIWLPIEIKEDRLVIKWLDNWSLNVFH